MLKFDNVSLRRGKKELFQNVNLTINAKTKVGLTGSNGCGKTSLIKMILGELHADEGELHLSEKLLISHVAQEISDSTMSAIDYVIDGDEEFRRYESDIRLAENSGNSESLSALYEKMQDIDGYTVNSRAARLLNGLGFSNEEEQKSVNSFSGGWRMRLNLAQALMCRSDILLLDEPTNHLDLEAIIWLESWLQKYNGIVILISHDRDFLNSICTQIVHIENKQVEMYKGNYDAFEKVRAERLSQQQAQFSAQQRQIKHMQSYIDRFRYKASKAKQAQSRVKALEKMELISAAQLDNPFHFSFENEGYIPQQLIKIDKVSTGYGDHLILRNISMLIQKGDKIGLLGFNGAGKSTLVKLIEGEIKAFAGEVDCAKELKVGYFAQHQLDQLHSDLSPVEHLKLIDNDLSEQEARNFLGGFNFHNDMAIDSVKGFSGGEKARLVLALLVYQKPNLLLLDEPTNHLDINMRHAMSVALQTFDGAMILVSHDRHLLATVSDKLLLVNEGEVTEFEGDLNDYYTWVNEQRKFVSAQNDDGALVANNKKQQRVEAAKIRSQQKPLRQKIRFLEKQLTHLHKQDDKLNQLLLDEEIYLKENADNLKRINIEHADIKKQIDETEQKWLEVSELLENQ